MLNTKSFYTSTLVVYVLLAVGSFLVAFNGLSFRIADVVVPQYAIWLTFVATTLLAHKTKSLIVK